ncbi:hypothetical protein [Halobaculum gomorrense]|uniref:Uncharacterized protein n=1 Tax=Halobaculum gomorrense TaxID=43928 RepID=A0A1M5T7I3_9EURY|nr:hypothetical protein [Halobaculum gomorrense]SHH46550.1 hypothetical protein SAMN05443636_2663 [Halobaculum gomorrense]
MTTHGIEATLTLFAAGTLTRTQAARKAGGAEDRFAAICARRGVETATPTADATGPSPANAD